MTIVHDQCGPLTLVYDDGELRSEAEIRLANLQEEWDAALDAKDGDRLADLLFQLWDLQDEVAAEEQRNSTHV